MSAKVVAAKKAAEAAPKLIKWALIVVLSVVLLVIAAVVSTGIAATHAAQAATQSGESTVANVEGWAHPLGGPKPWTTYYGFTHGLGAIDFPVPLGEPIFSIADGVVTTAAYQGDYGNVVHVLHPNLDVSVYAHMSSMHVRAGQQVTAGQQIGQIGSTGYSTGPHLHFEIRVGSSSQLAIRPSATAMAERGIDLGPCVEGPCALGY